MQLSTLRAARFSAIAAAAFLHSVGFAGDHYVSATAGSDLTGDGSAANPWKTITHALGQIPPGHQTVHVAPGLHDAAIGESFPISVPPAVRVSGAGPGSSVLDAGGKDAVAVSLGALSTLPRLNGFEIRNAARGVYAAPPNGAGFALADLSIEDVRQAGVHLGLVHFGAGYSVTLSGVRIDGSKRDGIQVSLGANTGSTVVTARDCSIENCAQGVSVFAVQGEPDGGYVYVAAHLVRSRVTHCAIGARCNTLAEVEFGATGVFSATDSLIAHCGTGLQSSAGIHSNASIELTRSTVAGNDVVLTKSGATDAYLWSTVVWSNQNPQLPGAGGSYCDTEGILLPGPGNLSVDPQFVDALNGDFHLLPTSPVIDQGDPATPQTGTDHQLDPRVIDGDGDGVARVDMGFDEWNPVHMDAIGTPSLGMLYALTVTAPPGWLAATFVSGGTADIPFGAPGSLLIDPTTAAVVSVGAVPLTWSLVIPIDPALLGLAFHAQAVGVAPAAAALGLSNRVDAAIQ